AGEKAYAAYDVTTETNKTKSGNDLTALQVTFKDKKWYIIEDNSLSAMSGTVTLLSADTTFGTKIFADNKSNKYSTSQVKAYLDSMTETGNDFADVADAIETVNLTTNKYNSTEEYETVNGVKLYLLSTEEANRLPTNVRKAGFTGDDCGANEWWLRSPGNVGDNAAFVYGDNGDVNGDANDEGYYVWIAFGVRPALKLNLGSVIFSSESKEFTVGSATVDVTGLSLDKTTAQTIDLDGKVSFKAIVEPDNATDKKVKWSVGGTNSGAVKLYTDEDCTTEVGADATDTLTVYAKGISAGSATVTATSNAGSGKSASCDVTVGVPKPEQTITASDVTATYGDTNREVNATVTVPATDGGAISYAVKSGSENYIDVASDGKLTIKAVPTTDKKAYVIVTAAETSDYAQTAKEVTITIAPRITIETRDDGSKVETLEDGFKTVVTEKDSSDQIIKITEIVKDGNKTTATEKDPDGNITKITETLVDGNTTTVTEKDPEDQITKTTETITKEDGSKTETVTEGNKTTVTEKDSGDKVTKTTETITKKDGSKTETVTEGNKTTVTEKDPEDQITKTTETVTKEDCQTAHCGRYIPHFDFSAKPSPIVPYRHLPQSLSGMTADCRSLV
ncbi:MAG: DUF6273 domain-containing protein, partial [Lachnospiraceae bacterium]|nr:DUF6273 domain-containing protein [Lachnospiraceae bacterium]